MQSVKVFTISEEKNINWRTIVMLLVKHFQGIKSVGLKKKADIEKSECVTLTLGRIRVIMF